MMKKLWSASFTYAILAMVGGVFYREFTKFNGFSGRTSLGFVHTHLFVLGMVFFLLALLLEKQFSFTAHKRFGLFFGLYNTGLAVTALTLVTRGVVQVLAIPMSKSANAALSGVSGIGHILLGVGIVLFFVMLKAAIPAAKPAKS